MFTSVLKDMIKDTDGQPDEEIHRVRFEGVPRARASVFVELQCCTLLALECEHQPRSSPNSLHVSGIFMEILSHDKSLTQFLALRGFAKELPRRGGSGRHDKVEQMVEVAWFKNRYFVALQTLRQAQGDGCLLLNFCHLRHLRNDSWLERGGDFPLLG